ncbi:MAG TPA: hypothetical protein PKA82_01620 [Pyrinomonadaceae bacterium]|nr:hypothetical protein [Pyrinomonadaceae bacterium]
MQNDQTAILKTLKLSAIAFAMLMLTGVATLMYISWDKDEDITGIVAPALFLTICSSMVAIITAVLQRRSNLNSRN